MRLEARSSKIRNCRKTSGPPERNVITRPDNGNNGHPDCEPEPPVCVELVRRLEDLQPYRDAWDRLAFISPQQLPALSHAWVSTYLEHRLRKGESWCCLLALSGSELVGVLPLVLTPEKVLGFRRILLRPPRDTHTISADAIVAIGHEAPVLKAFFAALEQVTPRWHAAKFLRLPQTSPTLLLPDNEYHRQLIICEPAGVGSYLPVTGDFEGYRASLSRNFRKNLKKSSQKLSQLTGVRTEFLTDEASAVDSLERFLVVETSGWKGREGSAIAQDPTLVEFYTTLVGRLARRGWLEWQFLVGDGRTLAGSLAVRCGRSLVICKIGYDESYASCTPGNMLFEQIVKRAFESTDVDQIDLISDMPWHYNWLAQRKYYQNLWIFPYHPLPLIADILPRKSREAMQRIRLLLRTVHRDRGFMHNPEL